ncbi:MAG: rRNA pseudouridine synthase [Clostridium sp.]|nr:rRNA pseudouridine synthase [Clostridium sp.]MDD7138815.1 pseudouridine synthase [Clostridium sp.]MDY6081956.1 pseudouridine synthase [Eubacteriales bacterium]
MERLQKFMAEAGVASRRACEELIRQGRVTVNGETASLGRSVEPEQDRVELDGKPVQKAQRRTVILLYKPRGVVSTSSDPEGRRTVQDYFREIPERLYNVGRLDLNSEGLLLMTNDGALANRLTHPRYGVEKTYYAVCDGRLTASEAAKLTNGIELEDGMTAPARVDAVRTTQRGDTSFLITIHEGRNRQIRRMLEAVGHRTLRLKRERFGPLSLGTLAPGEWRKLSDEEIKKLENALGL